MSDAAREAARETTRDLAPEAARDREPDSATVARSPPALSAVWRYGPAILITRGAAGLWQLILPPAHVPDYLLPTPSGVAAGMKADWPVRRPALPVTAREILPGFVIAVAAGVGLAVLLHLVSVLRRAVYPVLIGSQTIPVVVFAPVLVILFGYGVVPKLVIAALICFSPVAVNGIDGLRSVDGELISMMRTPGGSRWAILRRAGFPAALPSVFSGMPVSGSGRGRTRDWAT